MAPPVFDPNKLLGFAAGFAREALGNVFEPCGIPGCEAHSVGFVCKDCSRFTCLSHTRLRPTVPPTPQCVSCVVDAHPELFEAPQPHDAHVDGDVGVIDAEIVEEG